MEITATIFRYLSYLGLLAGMFLAFWEMRVGAIAFLGSIAFAHLAEVLRTDKHTADMEETLSILMSLATQSKEKCDSLTGSGEQRSVHDEGRPAGLT